MENKTNSFVYAIKKILAALGCVRAFEMWENIFRTRFATDMYIAQTNVVCETHKQTFGKYKNINQGKEIAIIATGPSLQYYNPIPNVINIGVNSSILYDKVKLDYFFAIDYLGVKQVEEELLKAKDLKKFFGIQPLTPYGYSRWKSYPNIIPESVVLKFNAEKYFVYQKRPPIPLNLNPDIDKTWLVDGGSCIFSAMQFALFTNPKRIYLVGCDCSQGYFNDSQNKHSLAYIIDGWKEFKKFIDIYYPDVEIVSINPVGLKGLFKDEYSNVRTN